MKKVEYKKILLTHDGSKLSSAAIPHAASLAKTFNAEILLLHVIESVEQKMVDLTPVGINIPIASVAETAMEIVAADKKTAEQKLKKITDKINVQNDKRNKKIMNAETNLIIALSQAL